MRRHLVPWQACPGGATQNGRGGPNLVGFKFADRWHGRLWIGKPGVLSRHSGLDFCRGAEKMRAASNLHPERPRAGTSPGPVDFAILRARGLV